MLNRYTSTSAASRMSWLHCVVSRKNSLMSLITNSRLATGRKRSSVPTVRRHNSPRTNRSAPSCAFVNPDANRLRWSIAPSATKAAAVVQRSATGNRSGCPRRKLMIAWVTHSLGRNGDVGVRSTAMKRSEEHTSELQSPSVNSYAVFCLKKKNHNKQHNTNQQQNSKNQHDNQPTFP